MKPNDAPLQLPVGARPVEAWAVRGAGFHAAHEVLIDEEPIAFEINGISHAVMLATPQDLEDFALGFLLTEGLIERAADLLDCEVRPGAAGTVLRLTVTARSEVRLKGRKRALAGRTGCGLCGVESLDQLVPPGAAGAVPAAEAAPRVMPEALARAMAALPPLQPLQHSTGGAHAAAWCRADGTPALVREDVGRHIALDKLAGALARSGYPVAQGFVVATSRASYEMVNKAVRAGVQVLAAVSAPTGRAVALAHDAGLTLAGFVRQDRATIYTHPERLLDVCT